MNTNNSIAALAGAGFVSHTIPVTHQVSPNVHRSFQGFAVSYNRSARDYGCDTTALVIGGRAFLLLKGNHALALAGAAEQGGLIAALTLFIMNLDQTISQSEHLEAFGLASDPFDIASTVRSALPEDQYTLAANTIRAILERANT